MIRPIFVASAAAILLSAAAPAHAQRFTRVTGQALVQLCTGSDRVRAEQCVSYIDAVADTAGFYQRLRPQDGSKGAALPGYLCIPENATGINLRDVVVRWLRAHSDANTRQASGVVMDALYAEYPCK